jgi:hypothetical protein
LSIKEFVTIVRKNPQKLLMAAKKLLIWIWMIKRMSVINYSQATKQQLYEIAINENNRMVERYSAVRELQKRKLKRRRGIRI